MSKAGLRFLAAVLTTGMVVVPFLGLDDLPRSLQRAIDADRAAHAQARAAIERAGGTVQGGLRAEPALFAARNLAPALPARIRSAEGAFAEADRRVSELARLRDENRRQDRADAERLLKEARERRAAALAEAAAASAEADRWLRAKRAAGSIEQDWAALRTADLQALEATIRKAQLDWPEKKDDLEARLAAVRAIVTEADRVREASEPQRLMAASGDWSRVDAARLLGAAEALANARAVLPVKSRELAELAGQLYVGWDKLLVDMEVRRAGETRDYQQKIRTVRTRITDPASKQSEIASSEQWVEVPRAQYEAMEGNLGMAVAHKDPGKYDSEAERVAQPAGFAYMAPPREERNRYGYWERRDGQSFWVWYGQYALLRDLLFNRDYRAPDAREYESYRSERQRGRTYYGRDERSAPRYGTSGSATQSRYSGSTYARGGGFRDSGYATRGGGYRGSGYETRGYRKDGDAATLPRQWGRGSFRPPAPRGWSSPRPSYSRPSFGRSGGMRFGGGGGRRR